MKNIDHIIIGLLGNGIIILTILGHFTYAVF